MKKILYLGPYRQNTNSGLLSRQLIQSIVKQHPNLAIQPLYIEDADNCAIAEIESLENHWNNEYDTIIQHAPINMIAPIYGVKNNIAIPIINNIVCSKKNIDTLLFFNKILVTNNLDYYQLSQYPKLKNKVFKYNFDILLPNKRAKINIGAYDQFNKVYTVIPNDIDAVLNIVTAFNIFNVENKHVLLLFINNLTPEDKNKLDSAITNLCHTMGIEDNRHIITFKAESDLQTLFAIHSSGNIYLSHNVSIISTKIAELLNVNIVDCDVGAYNISLMNNNSYFPDGIYTLSADTIKKYLVKSDYINRNTHSKVNHINSII